MSWLYSQALVEEYLGANYSDGEQSVQSSGNHTQQAYCALGKMTDFSRLSRFGMMFKPLTENRGEELLTLFRAGFHAKTSAPQERAQELMESEVVCGNTCQGLLEKSNQSLPSLKTPLCCVLEDSVLCSKTLPKWGIMLDGECYQQQALGLTTKGIGCGLLPTPTAHNAKEGAYPAEYKRKTPTLATHAGGKLNPMWVEWMMGWTLGWTDLKPLETDKSHCVQQQLGES